MIALSALVIFVVVGLAGLGLLVWFAGLYNGLVHLRNNCDKAWSNIDVLLRQRHDELAKLVDAVGGYMRHEKGVLEAVTRLRQGYDDATDTEDKVRIENDLNQKLGQLRVNLEAYPDLKANEAVGRLQERISALEAQIADRRELFNDAVTVYNITVERFPEVLLAGVLGYFRRDLLIVPDELKKDVKVSF